ncbi:MAG TPA: integrase core domain-containing protein [Bryobacteraceae bacterium]|nr:DDE-type integrase/transposase/recombinase [Acidobacteriaceae bacterium]
MTAHPAAEWTAHQLRDAFPWDSAPRYLLRDRDRIFGHEFVNQVKAIGIQQVLSAPRSPWQRAYIERLIGSIRRECLDHMIVFNERSLKQHLLLIALITIGHAHIWRSRRIARNPGAVQAPEAGPIVSIPELGGLHHRYERRAA